MRTFICEQLSRQPDLMRDMAEMGLSIENCEPWFEKAVGVMMMAMLVHIIIRVSFTSFLRGINDDLRVI